MDDVQAALRAAFEDRGYEVATVSVNRGQVRVALRDGQAEADVLRTITTEAIDEDAVFGVRVTTEAIGGQDDIGTVVSFRHRP